MASVQALILCSLLAYVMSSPILRDFLFDAPYGVDTKCTGGVTTLAKHEGKSVHLCAVRCISSASSCSGFNFLPGVDGCDLLSGTCTTFGAVTGSIYYKVN